MKTEHPILFSTPMVQAILEGRKTQTRRILNIEEGYVFTGLVTDPELCRMDDDDDEIMPVVKEGLFAEFNKGEEHIKFRFGKVGHTLWIRETWNSYNEKSYGLPYKEIYLYKANGTDRTCKWRPGIHMPKSACRIKLEISEIIIERAQDISKEDCLAEGIFYHKGLEGYVADNEGRCFHASDPRKSFMELWIWINGEESWEENPYVWVIKFSRLE